MLRKKQDPVLGSNKKTSLLWFFIHLKKLDYVFFAKKKHNYYDIFVK